MRLSPALNHGSGELYASNIVDASMIPPKGQPNASYGGGYRMRLAVTGSTLPSFRGPDRRFVTSVATTSGRPFERRSRHRQARPPTRLPAS